MATYKAISAGNWSDLAIWQDNSSGSFIASTVLPGVDDDVYPNNFIVTIDQTISVKSLRSNTVTGVVIGGRFNLSGNYDITTVNGIFARSSGNGTANIITDGLVYINTPVTTTINSYLKGGGGIGRCAVTCDTTSNITVNGNIEGGTSNNTYGLWSNNTSTIVVNGNIFGWTGSSSVGLNSNGINTNISIIGNCFAGSGTSSHGLSVSNANEIIIIGNLRGGTNASSNTTAIGVSTSNINILTITGNLIGAPGGGTGNDTLRLNLGSPIVNITGFVEGGNNASSFGINILAANSGIVSVTGNCTAFTGRAIQNASSNTQLFVTGNAYASSATNSIYNIGYFKFDGNLIDVASYTALFTSRLLWDLNQNSYYTITKSTIVDTNTLYGPGVTIGFPLVSDVRSGVIFGPFSGLVGSLVVPAANTVTLGVTYDNGTIGTAQNDSATFLTELLNSSDPLAERLRNVVTTSILGNQLAAFTN